MDESMSQAVFKMVREAMDEYTLERDIASALKKALDSQFDKTWHVIVGRSFGSYVTHEKGRFIYFYVGSLAFLVFKT